MRKLILLVFSTLFILANIKAQVNDPQHIGCHQIKQKLDQQPLTPEEIQWMQAALERSDTFDILHYEISLDLTAFDNSYLFGETRVEFRARLDSLGIINLDLEGLQVNNIISPKGDTLTYQHNGPLLKVTLDTTLNTGEEYAVTVNYEGIPITCPSGFGGFYFENGYAYNLGIGLQASPHNFGRAWFPCFDNFVERSTYTYKIISHDGRKAYAVGTLIDEQSLGGDTVMREFSMLQPIPTYLSHVAVSKYGEVRYMHQGKYGAIPILLVAKHEDTAEVRQSFEPLGEVVDCLEEWYGPYPFERIGYNMTSRGAMEHPTAVAYPDNSIQNGITNLGLITHELCHHWWGDITTLKTEFDMWLKEGPASYSEHQILECREGPEAFEAAVRANNVNMITSAHIADDDFHPLSPMPDEWTYGRTTYDKGAAMIHNLRGYLGDSLFKVGMQGVLNELAYKSIDAEEFRIQLEESTGQSLTDFFNNWIYSPGWSDFYVDNYEMNSSGDSITITVKQGVYGTTELHQNVPLRIAMYHSGDSIETVTMLCSGTSTVKTFPISAMPSFVYANPNQHLNLASAGDLFTISENGAFNPRYTIWQLQQSDISTPYDIEIKHHYIAPENDLPDSIPFRLSSTHFWTVHASGINGELSGRLDYTGGTGRELDFDLTGNTEDSILLVYRPNGASTWLEYPYYAKRKLLPTDGRGFFELEKVLPGQYAFANGPAGEFVNKQAIFANHVKVYPNPVAEQIIIDLGNINVEEMQSIQIVDLKGQILMHQDITGTPNGSIRIPAGFLSSGLYLIQLKSVAGEMYSRKFIKS